MSDQQDIADTEAFKRLGSMRAVLEESRTDRHTPGPWSVGKNGDECAKDHAICAEGIVIGRVYGAGYPLGKGWAPSSAADAARIVECVNSHDDLMAEVGTLRAALAASTRADEQVRAECDALRAALRSVEDHHGETEGWRDIARVALAGKGQS